MIKKLVQVKMGHPALMRVETRILMQEVRIIMLRLIGLRAKNINLLKASYPKRSR